MLLGRHAAQPAPARPHRVDRHRRRARHCPVSYAVLTADDVPGQQRLRARAPGPAGAGRRRRPLPGRAGGAGRGRPPRDRPARPRSAIDRSTYEELPGRLTDPRTALDDDAPQVRTHTGQPGPAPEDPHAATRRRRRRVVVALDFEVGMQDQAFLGPESGLAVPAEDGGVDLFVATQWLHVDQRADLPRARPAAGEGAADAWPASAARSAAARTCRCTSTPACSPCTPASR